MVFLRRKSGYFVLAESHRMEGRVSQKTVAYLGKAERAIARLSDLNLPDAEKEEIANQLRPFLKTGAAIDTPLLKWAGGKRRMVDSIRPFWMMSKATRLVEPFCGALSIALGLAPKKALLNDVNFHLINLYWHIQDGLKITLELDPKRFYEYRDRFNNQANPASVESAQLFYYLLRSAHSGLCRFNSNGKFNVPRQKGELVYPSVVPYTSVFQGWQFACGDFEELKIRKHDFVYADPPYDSLDGKDSFTSYFGTFGWQDQERLADWLSRLPCPVLASNHDTERIRSLYEAHGFSVAPINSHRGINSTGDRAKAEELLFWKS